MSLAQGNNTPKRPRIEPGSPDALSTRPVRSPLKLMIYRIPFREGTSVGFRCNLCKVSAAMLCLPLAEYNFI